MIELIENLDGSLTKVEKVGDSVTSYMPLFAGVKKSRTLEDGTVEEYEPYAELLAEAKAKNIKIKKKSQAEKDAIAKDEARRALKAERDAALQAIVFDLGAGKSVQVRPQDIVNFQLAISRTTDPIDWVLSDNSVEPLSIDILSQALAFGVNEGERIWKQYTDKLKVI